mgnify:CR=1 FL=1
MSYMEFELKLLDLVNEFSTERYSVKFTGVSYNEHYSNSEPSISIYISFKEIEK